MKYSIKNTKHLDTDKITIGILVISTLVAGGILSSVRTKADTAVADDITIVVPASCSLEGTIDSGDEHAENITPGNYVPDIGVTNLQAFCNDYNGFSIYAVGYSNDISGTTSMIGPSNQTIPTGLAQTGGTSQWSMKLTGITNPAITYNPDILRITNGFSAYSLVPDTLTQVVEYKDTTTGGSSATDQTLGANIETTYAAYISTTQTAGTYVGKVRYLLVHPANLTLGTYSISYNANGGSGTMTSESSIPNYEPHTIPTSTFTPPTGYVLAGWCTTQDNNATAQNPQNTCSGTSYENEGTIPASTGAAGGELNLYAYWKVGTLYDEVAAMSKGAQTNDDNATTGIQAAIVAPTESAPISSNSGVYEYNETVFGSDSDATNSSGEKDTIYYYRGILDSYGNTGTYGSNGLADAYPNYVILQAGSSKVTTDTCWRIVRTTGSGGVKMIYNGKWTGSTCANASTDAQVITSAFNSSSASNGYSSSLGYQNIHAVGYTYNNAVTGVGSASANTTIAKVFGSSSDYSANSSNSIIKQYIEQTWFSNISAYESILEPNAGYCNDRTLYPNASYALADKLAESTQIVPYGTSSMTEYFFGAYTRNANAAQKPTLGCPRGVVDIYSTTTASGGNGQLSKPVALLTADELSFAGSGSSTASQGSSSRAKSYLRSGDNFWLLSPLYRNLNGYVSEFALSSSGNLYTNVVSTEYGVRPAISLKPGTTATSGTGIATDPWVVVP